MPLPPFNESGDLPPGVHAATLEQVVGRFGGQEAFIAYWQVKRDGEKRGIVEMLL
jgi:hypothetical protein